LGIGTTSPGAKLHVESASAESVRIGYSSTKTARLGVTSAGDLQVYAFDSTAVSYKNILLAVDGSTSAGLVGVGTSSPVYKLVVSNGGASGIEFGPAFSGTSNLIQSYNRSGGAYVNTFYDASNHAFNISGTEGMRLTSTGLGRGTSSPLSKLHVNNLSTAITYATIGNNNGGTQIGVDAAGLSVVSAYSGLAIRFGNNSGATFAETMRLDSSGNLCLGTTSTLGAKFALYGTSAGSDSNIQITNPGYGTGCIGVNTTSSNFKLYNCYTSGTIGTGAGIDIGTNGQVSIGTSSITYKLWVYDGVDRTQTDAQFSITGNGYQAFHFLNATAYYIGQNSNSRDLYMYSGGNSAVGVRLAPGGVAWLTYSDERMKDIIEPIENALAKVLTLRAVIGKYKTDAIDKRRVFMIAQDVQAVLPEAVTTNAEGMLGMAYDHIVPLLTAAIKEQQALIQSLTARITALESKEIS
jgi:hypothetical protein